MRKPLIGALAGALFMALAAVAWAVTDTMQYSSVTTPSTKSPTKAKPANLQYRGIVKVETDPPGQQPDGTTAITVFFDKAIKTNSAKWPSCTQAEIDGKETVPAKCAKARVSVPGKSTATAYAGTPGNPRSQSVKEELTLEAYNGPSGKKLFLVVTSKPGAPVVLKNRVVPGTLVRASGPYGFAVRFDIPANLQEQLGLKISLTDTDLWIARTTRTLRIGGANVKASYLQLTSCPRSRKLASKAESKFRDNTTGALKAATSVTSSKC